MTAPATAQIGVQGQVSTTPLRRALYVLGRILLYAGLVFFTILFIAPFIWLISNSLKDSAHAFDSSLIPSPVAWDNYVTIFQEVPLLLMARNSIFVSVLGVVAVVFSTSMIAYALPRLRFPGRRLAFLAELGTR